MLTPCHGILLFQGGDSFTLGSIGGLSSSFPCSLHASVPPVLFLNLPFHSALSFLLEVSARCLGTLGSPSIVERKPLKSWLEVQACELDPCSAAWALQRQVGPLLPGTGGPRGLFITSDHMTHGDPKQRWPCISPRAKSSSRPPEVRITAQRPWIIRQKQLMWVRNKPLVNISH